MRAGRVGLGNADAERGSRGALGVPGASSPHRTYDSPRNLRSAPLRPARPLTTASPAGTHPSLPHLGADLRDALVSGLGGYLEPELAPHLGRG